MQVIKRSGEREDVSFDKIKRRITGITVTHALTEIDVCALTQKVIQGLYDGVKTAELDTYTAETAAHMTLTHPHYERFAACIAISNMHKQTDSSYAAVCTRMYKYVNEKTNRSAPLISDALHDVVTRHATEIESWFDYSRDYQYSYFGFKTLCRGYLLRMQGNIVERPQHMLMRVALGLYCCNGDISLTNARRAYDDMSRMLYTHASPTMFNVGTPRPQCSSCFLLSMTDDSIDGIYETLTRCAKISKYAGGIGIHAHCIRASGSYIAGTNGQSNGLVPMLRVFNATARYVDQGGGKRKGAFAVYLEPWHADIFDVLELKKNIGSDELRARDLFYALWIPDLFMRRVESNGTWSLMCPRQCPGLFDVHGAEFDALYESYEKEGRYIRQVSAQKLWQAIIESQIETGGPYMLYKDAANVKSNQSNLGTLRGSNLCTEVIQYTSPDEVAVCNLASVSLKAFIRHYDGDVSFDYAGLMETVKQMTRNLNALIDVNYYPVDEARRSNVRHRPIGLGVQGLQDTFFEMRYPFDSAPAALMNKRIFACIYYAACSASCDLSSADGPYDTFHGSPAHAGLLQPDLWKLSEQDIIVDVANAGKLDWPLLRKRVQKYGLRNSLLVAPMPTASTAQIMGNTECFEPQSSNVYSRTTLAGSFQVINAYLVDDLKVAGLWSTSMSQQIIAAKGSIQAISSIPSDLKALYKTVWEIKQRVIIDMAAARGPYIDQSQSLNIHMEKPTYASMTSMHFYAWRSGLKTGMYYLRRASPKDAVAFTVDKTQLPASIPLKDSFGSNMTYHQADTCSRDDPSCDSCGA